jgi:Ca2+-binding EF-hand superfamily protein
VRQIGNGYCIRSRVFLRSSRLGFVRLFALGLVGMLAACGSSQPAGPRWTPYPVPPPRDENYHGGPNAMLLKYDANHDGTLTREELIAGLKAEFAALDTNHTGCLTPDQVEAINQQRIAADQSTATPLQDWNQDGCVDFREYSAAAYSLFDQLDRNGDGKITPEEFNPRAKKQGTTNSAPPAQQRGRRGGPPPDGGSPPDGSGPPP